MVTVFASKSTDARMIVSVKKVPSCPNPPIPVRSIFFFPPTASVSIKGIPKLSGILIFGKDIFCPDASAKTAKLAYPARMLIKIVANTENQVFLFFIAV